MHGCVRKCPFRRPRPVGLLELMLDIEQPDGRGSGNENDGQTDQQERDDADAPNQHRRQWGNGEVRCYRRDPRQGARADHSKGQPLFDEKQKGWANSEHHKGIPGGPGRALSSLPVYPALVKAKIVRIYLMSTIACGVELELCSADCSLPVDLAAATRRVEPFPWTSKFLLAALPQTEGGRDVFQSLCR